VFGGLKGLGYCVSGAETLSIRGEALIRLIDDTQHQLDDRSSKCVEQLSIKALEIDRPEAK
jgi:hypothetical protein